MAIISAEQFSWKCINSRILSSHVLLRDTILRNANGEEGCFVKLWREKGTHLSCSACRNANFCQNKKMEMSIYLSHSILYIYYNNSLYTSSYQDDKIQNIHWQTGFIKRTYEVSMVTKKHNRRKLAIDDSMMFKQGVARNLTVLAVRTYIPNMSLPLHTINRNRFHNALRACDILSGFMFCNIAIAATGRSPWSTWSQTDIVQVMSLFKIF